MKHRFLVLALLLLCLETLSGNLVVNSTFDGLSPWRQATWCKDRGTLTVSNHALTLTNTASSQLTRIYQNLHLRPLTKYQLSFRLKGERIERQPEDKRGGASVIVMHGNGSTIFSGSPSGIWQVATGTFGWKDCTYTFTTPKALTKIMICLSLSWCTGQASFSDVRLRECSSLPRPSSSITFIPASWQNNTWNLASGMPSMLFCDLRTQPEASSSYTLDVTLPMGIELKAAGPWHFKKNDLHSDTITVAPTVPNSSGRCYSIQLTREFVRTLRPTSLYWSNYYRLYLSSAVPGVRGQARVRLLKDGQELARQQVILRVMPAIVFPRHPLRRFGLTMSYLFSLSAPDRGLRDTMLGYWTKLSRNLKSFSLFRFHDLPDDYRQCFLRQFESTLFLGANYLTPLGHFKAWQESHKTRLPGLVLDDGKELEWICPTYACKAQSPFWDGYVADLIQSRLKQLPGVRRIVWDVEPGAKPFCFCSSCRSEFSRFLKLDHILSTSEIQDKLATSWYQFRVRQNATVINNFASFCHRRFPGYEIALCTAPIYVPPPHYQEWCGVDVRLSDRHIYDLFMNMHYYQGVRWFDDIVFNQKNLKTPNYPLVDPSENLEMYYKRYTPDGILLNIVASAALGTRGFGFWPGDNFDATYLHAIARGVARVSDMEDYYIDGLRRDELAQLVPENVTRLSLEERGCDVDVTLPDFASGLRYTVHWYHDSYLLTVFNFHSTERLIVRIRLPQLDSTRTWSVVQDFNLHRGADVTKGFLAEIPAFGVSQFLITDHRERLSDLRGEISQLSLQKKLAIFSSRHTSANRFVTHRQGHVSVGWGVLPAWKIPLVKLSVGPRSIYVDPNKDAAIVGCYIDDMEDILASRDRKGVLDQPHLYYNDTPLCFKVMDTSIINGNPTVRLTAVVPSAENADPRSKQPAGLCIEKTLSFEANGHTIQSVYKLTNPASNNRSLIAGLRLKSYPRMGTAWKTGKALSSLWTFSTKGISGPIVFKGASNPCAFFLGENITEIPGNFAGIVQQNRYGGGPMSLVARHKSQQRILRFDLSPRTDNAGVMIWWSTNAASTVEPLTTETLLKPGEQRIINGTIQLETSE